MNNALLIGLLALLPLVAWAQSDADTEFFGEGTSTVADTKTSNADPTKQFSEQTSGAQWGGTVKSDATWQPSWLRGYPGESSASWTDSLAYDLTTTAFLDARPDKDFRFRLSLKTGYPFTSDTPVLNSAGTATTDTVATPNIKVWELFTDVTINDVLFLRFGKQSASWGVSYFYSPADVISLTAKDVTDPTAQREGPVALKATVPFPNQKANVTAFVLARDSYFGGDSPSIAGLGYALQGDILVGEAQLSLGGFYQKDNAPKGVATLNTGLDFLDLPVHGDLNLFSEAMFSYGSDVLKGSGTSVGTLGPVYSSVTPWEKTVYYTGTVGVSYSNSEFNTTLRVEYLYNPFGSSDKDAAGRAYDTYVASLSSTFSGSNTSDRDYDSSDAATPGIHNLTAQVDCTKIGGSELEFSTLWQQNLSDGSGWFKPLFTIYPWDQLGFNWGLQLVYGDNSTQFPLQFQSYDKNGNSLGTQRVSLIVGVTFGTGKY